MAFYEIVYIVRPDVSNNQVEQVANKFTDLVEAKKGKVIKSENWGLKNLAYRVRKHRKGYYTMLCVEADGAIIAEVERQMRMSDDVIRFLSIRVDKISKEPSVQMAPSRRRDEDEKDAVETPAPASRPNANPATPAAE